MSEHVVVNTTLGRLKGYTRTSSLTGQTFFAFEGIPFAKPPIGNLRFKDPVPHEGWDGIREALREGPEPLQPKMLPDPTKPKEIALGDEDCLYLGVFTHQVPQENTKTSLRPVVVSIHGGAFLMGSSNSNGPDFMMAGDIVFVNFSYRCGAFGFLSLETDGASGNMGLKDQTMVLKWVHNNIASFGGDPCNVTIMGISAGGASVHFHMMSPLSRGLFHKAIIQSGFAVNPWAIQNSPREAALDLARTLGCTSDDDGHVLDFLRSVAGKNIVEATFALSKENKYQQHQLGLIFLPCLEKASAQSFLTEHPEVLLETGKLSSVPVVLGSCLKEGSVVLFFGGVKESVFQEVNKNHELLVPPGTGIQNVVSKSEQFAEDVWQFYMGSKDLSWDNAGDYVKLQSDLQFNLGFLQSRASLLRFSSQPVFTYLFTNHQHCFCEALKPFLPVDPKAYSVIGEETCHGDDSLFLYTSSKLPLPEPREEQKNAILRHVLAWTSFAAKGDPNSPELKVRWPTDSGSSPQYMDIGTSWQAKKGLPFSERFRFWETLRSKYAED